MRMHEFPTAHLHNQENIKDPKTEGHGHREIASHHGLRVLAHKGHPALAANSIRSELSLSAIRILRSLGDFGRSPREFLPPEKLEGRPVPTDQGFRFYHHEGTAPGKPARPEQQRQPRGIRQSSGLDVPLLIERQLFPKKEILSDQ